MHVTSRHYAGNKDLVDALVKRQDDVKALITGIDGFRAYYLVRTGDGDAMTISVYDNAAGGEESVAAARSWISENLPDLNVGAPTVLAGDAALNF
jgi:hypothetical protein